MREWPLEIKVASLQLRRRGVNWIGLDWIGLDCDMEVESQSGQFL